MNAPEFQPTGSLPIAGTTTVLEASAGTGKTYALATLVTRYVAEGVPLGQILAVTFSRRATAELRSTIRGRLLTDRAVLAGESPPTDTVAELLAGGDPDSRELRRSRLTRAIQALPDAPICTLHTFANRMLAELGLLADHDPGSRLVTDLSDLAQEVIADCYLADPATQARLEWPVAETIGRAAIAHCFEPLYPQSDPASAVEIGYAGRVRAELDRRKRTRRLLSHDDLIGRLATTLHDPARGPAAAAALAARFRVVLVDEFQDTDPQQWEFLRLAFGPGNRGSRSALILIGDPKQAIYRFRGGDIETYTAARAQADRFAVLSVNHRSDEPVVRGVEALFGGVDLGTPSSAVPFPTVAVHRQGSRLICDDPSAERVRLRALRAPGQTQTAQVRDWVCHDVVDQLNLLLSGGHRLLAPGPDGQPIERPVGPGDIAILVNQNRFGAQLHQLLLQAGYQSVFSGTNSVFDSPAAEEWQIVLAGLASSNRRLQRRAMLTNLIGWDSARMAATSDTDLVATTELLGRCAGLLADRGVQAVLELLLADSDGYARLLAQPGGETLLSDLQQLAELLDQARRTDLLDPAGLLDYLSRARQQAAPGRAEHPRRLASDRPAIRILTVHQAKGLQFPIVLLPQASDNYFDRPDSSRPVIGHHQGRRVLDVAGPPARRRRYPAYHAEELAESLRSLYVACTRAESLLVCWWSGAVHNTSYSALHRLLHADIPGSPPAASYPWTDAGCLPVPPRVSLTVFEPATGPLPPAPPNAKRQVDPGPELAAAQFIDHIDQDWRRTSYTGLTALVHEQPTPAGFDEASDGRIPGPGTEPPPAPTAASALAQQPGGVRFGSLVHEILEVVDPADPQVAESLTAQVRERSLRRAIAGLEIPAVASGLLQTITTPLGVLTGDRSLRDLGAANRLTELDFELPLGAAGHLPRRRVADLAALFDTLPPDDPLAGYGRLLAESPAADQVLTGFLTGSIDVVLRVPDDPQRFVVLDYKTNRMPNASQAALVAADFTPAAMTAAMFRAHYPLQALLYCTALHRYLGWRLPDYRPELHLGGVGYLFVRGMTGPGNPRLGTMPAGVFTWLPPAGLVVAAAQILTGGSHGNA